MLNVDILNIIQNVQDSVIHLKVDKEQWKIVFTLKTVPISTQCLLTSALVQLTRMLSVVTG